MNKSSPYVCARVADKKGAILGWIAAKPCRVTGDTNYTRFDFDAVKFPDESAAQKRAARDGVNIVGINRYK